MRDDEAFIHFQECLTDLNAAWRILEELQQAQVPPVLWTSSYHMALIEYAKPFRMSRGANNRRHVLPAPALPDAGRLGGLDVGTKTIHYIYDFGDNWHHVIKVEKIDDAIRGADYPRLVRAIGACPPEDVGGFPGYADFLEAMADPKHEEHDRMLDLYGGKFDPEEAEIGRILDNFERLAKKWTPKPRKPKAANQSVTPAASGGCLLSLRWIR